MDKFAQRYVSACLSHARVTRPDADVLNYSASQLTDSRCATEDISYCYG